MEFILVGLVDGVCFCVEAKMCKTSFECTVRLHCSVVVSSTLTSITFTFFCVVVQHVRMLTYEHWKFAGI